MCWYKKVVSCFRLAAQDDRHFASPAASSVTENVGDNHQTSQDIKIQSCSHPSSTHCRDDHRHCQKTLPDFTREFLSNLPAYPTHSRMMSVNPHVRFLCSVSSKPSWPQASPALPTCPTWHLSLRTPSLPLPSVTFRLRQVKLWRLTISSEMKSAWISDQYSYQNNVK